jgi:hypothetical protein
VYTDRRPRAKMETPDQLTTDGFGPYPSAMDNTLSGRVDVAQLIKVYRSDREGEARCSPLEAITTEVIPIWRQP